MPGRKRSKRGHPTGATNEPVTEREAMSPCGCNVLGLPKLFGVGQIVANAGVSRLQRSVTMCPLAHRRTELCPHRARTLRRWPIVCVRAGVLACVWFLAVGSLRAQSESDWMKQLADNDPFKRAEAIHALYKCKASPESLVPALFKLFPDKRGCERFPAMDAPPWAVTVYGRASSGGLSDRQGFRSLPDRFTKKR